MFAAAARGPHNCTLAGGAPGYTGVVVTSAGGTGTTSMLVHLKQLGLRTNHRGDADQLKHMLPGCRGFRSLHAVVGARPLVLFLYDDPAAAALALAAKGWVSVQAAKLAGGTCRIMSHGFRSPGDACLVEAARAHSEKDYRAQTNAERGCPAGAEPTPPVPPSRRVQVSRMAEPRPGAASDL